MSSLQIGQRIGGRLEEPSTMNQNYGFFCVNQISFILFLVYTICVLEGLVLGIRHVVCLKNNEVKPCL